MKPVILPQKQRKLSLPDPTIESFGIEKSIREHIPVIPENQKSSQLVMSRNVIENNESRFNPNHPRRPTRKSLPHPQLYHRSTSFPFEFSKSLDLGTPIAQPSSSPSHPFPQSSPLFSLNPPDIPSQRGDFYSHPKNLRRTSLPQTSSAPPPPVPPHGAPSTDSPNGAPSPVLPYGASPPPDPPHESPQPLPPPDDQISPLPSPTSTPVPEMIETPPEIPPRPDFLDHTEEQPPVDHQVGSTSAYNFVKL